ELSALDRIEVVAHTVCRRMLFALAGFELLVLSLPLGQPPVPGEACSASALLQVPTLDVIRLQPHLVGAEHGVTHRPETRSEERRVGKGCGWGRERGQGHAKRVGGRGRAGG